MKQDHLKQTKRTPEKDTKYRASFSETEKDITIRTVHLDIQAFPRAEYSIFVCSSYLYQLVMVIMMYKEAQQSIK